jgi:hypothetical protein
MSVYASIAIVLLSLTGIAHAGQIASPPVFSGHIACYIRNVGTQTVSVTVQITGEDGSAIAPSFQNCDVPLAPGVTCVVLAESPSSRPGCSATAASGVGTLRGTIETRDDNFNVITGLDLR